MFQPAQVEEILRRDWPNDCIRDTGAAESRDQCPAARLASIGLHRLFVRRSFGSSVKAAQRSALPGAAAASDRSAVNAVRQ